MVSNCIHQIFPSNTHSTQISAKLAQYWPKDEDTWKIFCSYFKLTLSSRWFMMHDSFHKVRR